MTKNQRRNLGIVFFILISFIIWGIFFNNKEKSDISENTHLSLAQIKLLSNSLIIPNQGDMKKTEYDKMNVIFKKDFIINFLDSFNELKNNEKKLIWENFKEFYFNQIKIKEQFENSLSYKFMAKNISYIYEFEIINSFEYKVFLFLYVNKKQERVFEVDFSKKEKDFKIKSFSKEYLNVYMPYINTKLYIPNKKKNDLEKIFNLLENSSKRLKDIRKILGLKK